MNAITIQNVELPVIEINCQSVQEIAKVLGTGPNRLFKFLRDEGLLMRNNLPYQQHLDAGHFRVVEKQYNDGRGESHTYTRTGIEIDPSLEPVDVTGDPETVSNFADALRLLG